MIRRILRGISGHPGNVTIVLLLALGAVSGIPRNPGGPWWMPLAGAGIMLAIFGPPYLVGCWTRGENQ